MTPARTAFAMSAAVVVLIFARLMGQPLWLEHAEGPDRIVHVPDCGTFDRVVTAYERELDAGE